MRAKRAAMSKTLKNERYIRLSREREEDVEYQGGALKNEWQKKKLGELCKIELGRTPARANSSFRDEKHETGNVWLSIADLLNAECKIVGDSKEYVSDKGAKICKLVRKGTLLVSFKLTLGRLAFAGRDLFTNEAIAALSILNERELTKPFLFYFLLYFDWIKAAKNDVKLKGMTLYKAKLIEMEVLFPKSLLEQHRIVAILDEAFAGISTAKANAEKNLQNAHAIFDSHMQSIFTQRGKDWVERKLGEICGFVRGPFGGSLKKSIFVSEGFAVYEQQHAIDNQFDDVRYFINEAKFGEMKRFELQPNDLIMSCSGTMGRVAIVPQGIKRGIINQALLKLTPTSNISNTFLKYWMESKAFKDSLQEYSGGAAIQNVASVKILKEIKLPLPSVREQKHIVDNLQSVNLATQRHESIYRQKLAALDELKKSLLDQAFSGRL
jgi:type I restriction enzyme S subunit